MRRRRYVNEAPRGWCYDDGGGGGLRGVRGGVADLLRDVKRNNYRVHSPIHVAAFLKACNWHNWHLLEQKLDKVIVI